MGWLAAFVLIPTVLSAVLVRDAGLALQSFLSSVLLLGIAAIGLLLWRRRRVS